MATPLATDQFSRFMTEMFDEKEIIGVSTVWQSFFGRPEHPSRTIFSDNAKVVEIDIMRGNERLAALIHRGTNSRHLGDIQRNTTTQNFSTFSRVYPLGEEMGDITADQILERMAGENPYENRSRIDRMRSLAQEHHLEHIRRYVRLFEVLAGSSILTGQMPAILGTNDANMIYDFRRNAAHFMAVATAWDAVGADILGDIDAGCDLLRENGHVEANVLFLAGNVAHVFFADTSIQAMADIRGFSFISVGANNPVPANLQPLVDGGAVARGYIFTPQGRHIWLFCYNDIYTDGAGVAQPYMPAGSALLAFYGARCDRYFGPPELLPVNSQKAAWYQEMFGMNMNATPMPTNVKSPGSVISPSMFYSDAYEATDGKKVTIRTQAAPIYATTQTDAFVTFSGLITSDAS